MKLAAFLYNSGMAKNLTQGSVFSTIIRFASLYLVSYFLQTLYGMADLFIVGQYNGADVISAVAIGSQIMHMLTVIIVGLSMGTTVLSSRAVGSNNLKEAARIIGNSTVLFIFVSFAATLVLLFCTPLIISLMSVPSESVLQTELYLKVCFAGIPFITAFNIFASVYRGLGDSKSPMIFVAIACVSNIVLDYVFVGIMGLQAKGAALATILAQLLSVIVSFFAWKKGSAATVKLSHSDFRIDFNVLGSLLKIGFPVACQDGFIQVSFLIITVIANRRGVDIAAAVGIVEKIICFLFLVPSSMLSAISAISAQNMGAGQHGRARKTLFYGAGFATCVGIFFAILFQFVSEPVVAMFTHEDVVITFGTQYLKSYVFDCVFAAIHFSFSGFFCAYGYSIVSFIHNTASILLVRIPGAWFASEFFPESLYPMGWAAPLGSLLSAIICVAVFAWLLRKGKLGKG